MDSVGERVKQIRISKGITQTELADSIGSTKGAISRYEQGKREFRFEQIQGIADYLGVSVFDLYGLSNEKKEHLERSREFLAKLKEIIQSNSSENPDKIWLEIDDILRSKSDEVEKELQLELNLAQIKHSAQVASTLIGQPDEKKEPEKPTQLDPAIKVQNKRVGDLVDIFTTYPNDTQNRILDVAKTFGRLNNIGQKHAVGRIKELAEIPRYQMPQEGDKKRQFTLLWMIQEYLEQKFETDFNPTRKPVLVEDTPSYILFELQREDNAELWSIWYYPSDSEADFEDILRQAEDQKLSTKVAVVFPDEDSCKKMIEFYEEKTYNSDVNAEGLAAIGQPIDPIGLPSIKLLRIDGETVEETADLCHEP